MSVLTREEREFAVRQSIAIVMLDGLPGPSEEVRADFDRYIDGELTIQEVKKRTLDRLHERYGKAKP